MLSCPQVVKSPSPDCSTRLTNSHSILPVYYALMITYSSPMLFFYRNCLTPRFNFSNSNSRTLFISTCKSGAYHVARVPFERERERGARHVSIPSSKAVGAEGGALAQKARNKWRKMAKKLRSGCRPGDDGDWRCRVVSGTSDRPASARGQDGVRTTSLRATRPLKRGYTTWVVGYPAHPLARVRLICKINAVRISSVYVQ
jgi:hypothetical protein